MSHMNKNVLLDFGIGFFLLDREASGVAGGVVTVTVVEPLPLMHATLYSWHSEQVSPILPVFPAQVLQGMPFDRHLLQGGSMRPWRCWKGISHEGDNRWLDLRVWERLFACDVGPKCDELVASQPIRQ